MAAVKEVSAPALPYNIVQRDPDHLSFYITSLLHFIEGFTLFNQTVNKR